MKFIDISGEKFTHLTAIRVAPRGDWKTPSSHWICKCDCGKTKLVSSYYLRKNRIKSCGCMSSKMTADGVKSHGESKTRFYHIWASMRQRCNNPKCHAYSRYGGRGITHPESWNIFEGFKADMAHDYQDHLTLERKDNNAPYSRENCIWATYAAQSRNMRSNRMMEAFGQKKSLIQWSEDTKLSYATIMGRLRMGWKPERILTTHSRLDKTKIINPPI